MSKLKCYLFKQNVKKYRIEWDVHYGILVAGKFKVTEESMYKVPVGLTNRKKQTRKKTIAVQLKNIETSHKSQKADGPF